MQKILAGIVMIGSVLTAQAGPLEELVAAFEKEKAKVTSSDKVQNQSLSQTVIRGYLPSNSGLMALPSSSTQFLGTLAPRAACQAGAAQAGYQLVSTQNRMEFYRETPSKPTMGFILLMYYDLNNNCSEVYLTSDTL